MLPRALCVLLSIHPRLPRLLVFTQGRVASESFRSPSQVVWALEEPLPLVGDVGSGGSSGGAGGGTSVTVTQEFARDPHRHVFTVPRFGTDTVVTVKMEEKAGGRTVITGEVETKGQYAAVQLASMWNSRWYNRVKAAGWAAEVESQGAVEE